MSIRKAAYIVIVFFTLGIGAALSSQHYRWLIFNGFAATEYANQLLLQQLGSTPDWAIDLVISADPHEKVVFFSAHDSEFTYAYSAKESPSTNRYLWRHLVGSWYVGEVKT